MKSWLGTSIALGAAILTAGAAVAAMVVPAAADSGTATTTLRAFDFFMTQGASDSPEVTSSLRAKLTLAAGAATPEQQGARLHAFAAEITAQGHQHVAASVAATLSALAEGRTPPASFSIDPAAQSLLGASVGQSLVTIDLPPNGISSVSITGFDASNPPPPVVAGYVIAAGAAIHALDAQGQPVVQLTAPARVTETYTLPAGANPLSATLVTVQPTTGTRQALTTSLARTSAGDLSASAWTSHFSPYAVMASPPDVTSVAPPWGPQAGGTNITLYGSGFTGATGVIFGTFGSAVPTVVSDTQLTVVSPAGQGSLPLQVAAGGQVSSPTAASSFQYFAPLSVGIQAYGSPVAGQPYQFGSWAIGGVAPITYSWNFGDGGTGSGASPTTTYASPGSYSVSLNASDPAGNTASAALTVNVANPGPPLSASILPINALDVGSGPTWLRPQASGGTAPYQVSWAFGDGRSAAPVSCSSFVVVGKGGPCGSVVHSYTAAGTYAVTLTVTDAAGAVTTASASAVINPPLTVNATASPLTGVNALTVNFAASVTGGTPPYWIGWKWNPMGFNPDASGPTGSTTFAAPGSYYINLTVYDHGGGAYYETFRFAVEQPLTVQLWAPATTADPTGYASVTLSPNPGPAFGTALYPATVTWHFGDGTPDQVVTVPTIPAYGAAPGIVHTYAVGSYQPSVTWQAPNQTATSAPFTLVVSPMPPMP